MIAISTWIDSLVLKAFNEFVKRNSQECSEERSDPVDPVVSVEVAIDDIRAERSRWIQRAA